MGIGLWLSKRLSLNAGGRGAGATGVVIAVAGVTLALVIMEFTLAVVSGFKESITDRVTGFDGKIWIEPDYDVQHGISSALIIPDDTLLSAIRAAVPDARVSGRFSQPGLIKTDEDFAAVYFVAYDDTHDYNFERSFIIEGTLPDFSDAANADDIVISRSIARAMRLGVGDRAQVCFFVNDAVKSRKYRICGIYDTGFGDYDRTVAFAGIGAMRSVASAPDVAFTRLDIDGVPIDMIAERAEQLQLALISQNSNGYSRLFPVDNVLHTGMVYFNWLDLLDTNVVVIFILMIFVAGFTLVSSMFIIILERIPTIGILRALGTNRRQIRAIFINLSMRIVLKGMIIGNIIGLGLLLLQQHYRMLPLDPEMYYLTHVPVSIHWWQMLLLNVGVLVVTWLILVLPSRVASRISPAVTMRFE